MAGMSVRSARKWQSGSLPSETSQDRWWRIRPDPFDGIWQEEMLLPSFLREYGKLFAQYAAEGVDHPQYLLRLADLEIIDRHQRMVERPDPRRPIPRGEESGHPRLPGHPLAEQGAGDGTGTL